MRQAFEAVLGPVEWESDEQGFVVAFHRRTTRARWSEVTAAGLVSAGVERRSSCRCRRRPFRSLKLLPGFDEVAESMDPRGALPHSGADTWPASLGNRPPIPVADEAVRNIANEGSNASCAQPLVWRDPARQQLHRAGTGPAMVVAAAHDPVDPDLWTADPVGVRWFRSSRSEAQGGERRPAPRSIGLPSEITIGGIVLAYRRIWWWR